MDIDSLISYVKSVEGIFVNTALFLLPVLGLRLLTAVRHPRDLDMPSWAPDWSQRRPLTPYYFGSIAADYEAEPDTFFVH